MMNAKETHHLHCPYCNHHMTLAPWTKSHCPQCRNIIAWIMHPDGAIPVWESHDFSQKGLPEQKRPRTCPNEIPHPTGLLTHLSGPPTGPDENIFLLGVRVRPINTEFGPFFQSEIQGHGPMHFARARHKAVAFALDSFSQDLKQRREENTDGWQAR